MATEIIPTTAQAVISPKADVLLPVLVQRAGGAARFAWDEFFFAEHHNPHTQKAYMAAVRRFLAWCEGEGGELVLLRYDFGLDLHECVIPRSKLLALPGLASGCLEALAFECPTDARRKSANRKSLCDITE